MKIVAIEGGIASGKSTLIGKLPELLTIMSGEEWVAIKEPVDEDPEFKRLLEQFINNPTDANKRAEFQMYITRSRQGLLKDIPDGNYIIERSLYSDLVFTQCNMLSTEGPTGAYQAAYYDIKDHLKDYPRVDLVMYLNRDPDACLKSMKDRDRGSEGCGYSLEYFEDLHNFHMACLPQITRAYGCKYRPVCLDDRFADPDFIAHLILEHI